MNYLLLISSCFIALTSSAQLKLEGTYLGTNIYVQNPTDNNNEDFCVDSVIVNGKIYTGELDQMGFQIDLAGLGFEVDTPIEILIYHKSECKPKVLNQNHQYNSQAFKFDAIRLENNKIIWSADNRVPGRFEVQVYRWNKWVTLDTLNRSLSETEFQYTTEKKLHTGENNFRIRFVAQSGKTYPSQEVSTELHTEEVEYTLDKKTNVMTFSRSTQYEIFDEWGTKVISGEGSKVLLYRLANKKYFLNLDNRYEEIKLKR